MGDRMKLILKFFVIGIFTTSLFANQPHKLNFQGILTDPHGATVVDSTYAFGFSIYDAEVAGNKLWEESKLLTTSHGIYQTTLGNDSTLNTLSFNAQYYVQITVNSTVLPLRTKLTTVPYAISANNVTGTIAATATIADGLVIKSINGLQNNMDIQVEGSLTMTVDPVENKIILEGVAPVEGIQGPVGPQGIAGADGTIGVDGVAGAVGPKGDTGNAGHGLKIDGTCNSSARGAGNSYANLYTCLDPSNSELWIYISGSFSNLGKVSAHPDTIAKWNAGYDHTLPTNDSLHFTSTEKKNVAERSATTGRDGYLTSGDFSLFKGAADSISILALQDTTYYNSLVGFDTDIYDSIGRATTLLSTSISQLSGSIADMWTTTDDTIYTTNRTVINSNSLKAPLTINKSTSGNMVQAQWSETGGNIYMGSGSSGRMWPVIGGVSEMTDKGLGIYAYPHDTATYTGFTSAAIFMNARQHYNGKTHNYNPLTSGNLLQVANADNVKMTISHDGQLAYSNGEIPSNLHKNYHYQFLGGGHVIITDTATGYIYNAINAYITSAANEWAFINSSKDAIVISHISTGEMVRKQFIPTGSTNMNFMLEQYRVMTQNGNGDLSISGSITVKSINVASNSGIKSGRLLKLDGISPLDSIIFVDGVANFDWSVDFIKKHEHQLFTWVGPAPHLKDTRTGTCNAGDAVEISHSEVSGHGGVYRLMFGKYALGGILYGFYLEWSGWTGNTDNHRNMSVSATFLYDNVTDNRWELQHMHGSRDKINFQCY